MKYSRENLLNNIKSLISGEISWYDFDNYFTKLESDNNEIYDIAEIYWSLTNPEEPDNTMSNELHCKVMLFLSSNKAYGGSLKYKYSIFWFRTKLDLSNHITSSFWPFKNEQDFIEMKRSCKNGAT